MRGADKCRVCNLASASLLLRDPGAGRAPPRPPHTPARTLCPGLGGLGGGGGGCIDPRVSVGVREGGASAPVLRIPPGGAGRWGAPPCPPRPGCPVSRLPAPPDADAEPLGPSPGAAVAPLPPPAAPHPGGGGPAALRPLPRSALARRSLAVSRLPPLPSTPPPPSPKSPFPNQHGREVEGVIGGGADPPPPRPVPCSPTPPPGRGDPPAPGGRACLCEEFPLP